MLKKFTEGLVFGAGFAVSFIALWFVSFYLLYPKYIDAKFEHEGRKNLSIAEPSTQPSVAHNPKESDIQFHELELDDQIKTASVIALAKYEPSPDGKMKAIIKEFLKKDSNTTIYYNVGDEYQPSSYYPKDKTSYGDGLIIFFTDSPATMKMSMTYTGDRIRGLGDLPIELLRKKCNE